MKNGLRLGRGKSVYEERSNLLMGWFDLHTHLHPRLGGVLAGDVMGHLAVCALQVGSTTSLQ